MIVLGPRTVFLAWKSHKKCHFYNKQSSRKYLRSSREVSEAPNPPQITPIVQVLLENVYLECGHSLGFVSMSKQQREDLFAWMKPLALTQMSLKFTPRRRINNKPDLF